MGGAYSARAVARLGLPVFVIFLTAAPVQRASAQYPGELVGRVTDALTGEPVQNVLVQVVGAGMSTFTDGLGEFRIRGLEEGRLTLRLSRLGYAQHERDVEVRQGATVRLSIRLGANPVQLEEVRAEAERTAIGVTSLSREQIESSGELNAAGLLQTQPGVVVRRRGPAGPTTVSIRGSSADEVLVLLDGAPLNDPLTGAADLSSIPASQIESITVYRGSQSAHFGPGAAGGAVLIQSRVSAAPLGLALETGSLGYWSAAAETSFGASGFSVSAGTQLRTADGQFEYRKPNAVGGDTDVRVNSDISEGGAFVAAAGQLGGGDLRLRVGYIQLERGIPGPSFAPTPVARERLRRWRGQAAWSRDLERIQLSAQLYGVTQVARFADPAPPVGPAYDSQTDALVVGGRLAGEVPLKGSVESVNAGLELRQQSYESTALSESAPSGRFDFGTFVGTQLGSDDMSGIPRLVAALRLDRDGLGDTWYVTHDLTLTLSAGPADFHIRHASSYNPPNFGDQYFRAGVAVEPNPDLQAERVPSDLSIGVELSGSLGPGLAGRFAVDGYTADVKNMILWSPDFRFVWSPRNFDVKRRGLDAEGSLELTGAGLSLRANYSYVRATYDRPGDDDVQILYRPRHSGVVGASWRPGRWQLITDARYVGVRYPVPAPVNALDAYWVVDLRLRRAFVAGAWEIVPTLAVERLLNNDDSLIFGYPEPGRLVRLEIAARPRGR